MCNALLVLCAQCAWTLHISYPLCGHATAHNLSPNECPKRMRRCYDQSKQVCARCAAQKRGSLALGPCTSVDREGDGEDSYDEDENQEDGERNETWERMRLSFVGIGTIGDEPRARFGRRKHRGKRRKMGPSDGETTQQSVAETTSKKR